MLQPDTDQHLIPGAIPVGSSGNTHVTDVTQGPFLAITSGRGRVVTFQVTTDRQQRGPRQNVTAQLGTSAGLVVMVSFKLSILDTHQVTRNH